MAYATPATLATATCAERTASPCRWATSTSAGRTRWSARTFPTLRSGCRPTWRGIPCTSRKGDEVSDAPDLVRLFGSLPLPVGNSPAGRFSAQSIPGIPSCSVGKDATGCPVLLVETDASGPRAAVAPVVLQNLSVLHNVDCRIRDADGRTSVHRVSVIRCCGDEQLLREYFSARWHRSSRLCPHGHRGSRWSLPSRPLSIFSAALRSPHGRPFRGFGPNYS